MIDAGRRLDLSRSKATEPKLSVAAIAPEDGPLQARPNALLVVTRKYAGRQAGGGRHDRHRRRHAAARSRPAHQPAVTAYLGGGRYRMEGVKFNMAGWWELQLRDSAPPRRGPRRLQPAAVRSMRATHPRFRLRRFFRWRRSDRLRPAIRRGRKGDDRLAVAVGVPPLPADPTNRFADQPGGGRLRRDAVLRPAAEPRRRRGLLDLPHDRPAVPGRPAARRASARRTGAPCRSPA